MPKFLLYIFAAILLAACSNSQSVDEPLSIIELSEIETCSDGVVKFVKEDSAFYQCKSGKWKITNEEWTQATISERFLPVEQGKFIPNANFNTPFTLQPPQALNQGEVRCTFDGSEPDSTTSAFTENKLIDTTTVVRCYEFVGSKIIQKQTETYFINESINMPVVSISVDPVYVKDYLDAEPCKPHPCYEAIFWKDVEYPTHVEYFAKGSSATGKGFEIDAGISINGNSSRNQQKKSVSITMRKEYQKGKLHYSLFETRPENNKFKAFILRNNGQRFISDYIEDAMATSLLEGTNVDYQRSNMVVVFYNGQYRGIYDMREKLDEHFVNTNYGLPTDNIDFIKQQNASIKTINGDNKSYLELLQYIYNTEFVNNDSAYSFVTKQIDIKNFMEYIAAETFYQNGDWPQNNVRAWKTANGQWKFIAFDIDMGFGWKQNVQGYNLNMNMFDWITNGGSKNGTCKTNNSYTCFHNIFAKLIQNATFKREFINRASYIYSMFINGDKVSEKIDHINKKIDEKQIIRDQHLYLRKDYTNVCNTGFDTYGKCLKSWAKERDSSVRKTFQETFNLGDVISITIEINGNGRLKLDNMYVTQTNVYNWSVFANHPMQLTIECYAGSKFKSWEDNSIESNRIILPKKNHHYIAVCL